MPLIDDKSVRQLIAAAKAEDLGEGDITSKLLDDPRQEAAFHLIAKQQGVVAGNEIASSILAAYDPSLTIEWTESGVDGTAIIDTPTDLATVRGPIAPALGAERVLLNFLQRLCGIATLTRAFVDAVEETGANIFDTRKTTPVWRALERYAVRCGGGRNHRYDLSDAVLIKDNHVYGVEPGRTASVVFDMLNRLDRQSGQPAFVEVEADNLAQVEELLKVVGIDIILLDNFDTKEMQAAVALRDAQGLAGKVQFEASGGVTLKTVRSIARTGVERISIGALTHSAPALDLSLERFR